jgi:fermentation-respiration switch protein FrsA (DUF1100 family)
MGSSPRSPTAPPPLIIHAERDHLIPLSDGRALFNASPAADKEMLTIPGANHNDIFLRAWPSYLSAVVKLLATTPQKSGGAA